MSEINDRRLLQRTRLALYLNVLDATTAQSLGHIIDINVCGFLLLSKTAWQEGSQYTAKIELPDTTPQAYAQCQAIVRRVSKSVNPSFYENAFEITDISPDNRELIEQLEHALLLKFGQ